jgi:hypothetical protein
MDSEPLAVGDGLVTDVSVFGQQIDIWVQPHLDEIARRETANVQAITTPDVIRALISLPVGRALSTSAISPLDRLVVEELPPGLVQRDLEAFVRLASPPVDILRIVKRVRSWADVEAVSLLRTHAPRVVVAPRRLALRVLRNADTEIGVVAEPAADVVLRQPGSRWVRPSWQRWLVAEVAYEAWRASGRR